MERLLQRKATSQNSWPQLAAKRPCQRHGTFVWQEAKDTTQQCWGVLLTSTSELKVLSPIYIIQYSSRSCFEQHQQHVESLAFPGRGHRQDSPYNRLLYYMTSAIPPCNVGILHVHRLGRYQGRTVISFLRRKNAIAKNKYVGKKADKLFE